MKILLALFITIFSAHSMALTVKDLVSPTSQKILGGCGAGLILATVTGQDVGVGLSVCAGVAAYTYIDDYHSTQSDELMKDMKNFVDQSKKEITDSNEKLHVEYASYQEAIRKVVLEKLSEIQAGSEKRVEEYIKTPQFESVIQKQTEELISRKDGAVSESFLKMEEEIRRKVTEDVMREFLDQTNAGK